MGDHFSRRYHAEGAQPKDKQQPPRKNMQRPQSEGRALAETGVPVSDMKSSDAEGDQLAGIHLTKCFIEKEPPLDEVMGEELEVDVESPHPLAVDINTLEGGSTTPPPTSETVDNQMTSSRTTLHAI
ncbi:hypothetical protein NDU88_007881 [Pleurodeles waltl]|uniref:Uncharacterized protein n=1 Tax=Pleurodeles waltl TaxID=8319 RepID=A0AAV7N6M9_PLEWA|nr:hypothetical protein NDU88_007881 [Pleurodeles waltl]